MSSPIEEYDGEFFLAAQDFIEVAQQVRDEFRPLFEEIAASGDEAQLQEVKDYMNEEAQSRLRTLGEITGFEVDFEFDFEGVIDFDQGVEVECYFFPPDPPGGTPQA